MSRPSFPLHFGLTKDVSDFQDLFLHVPLTHIPLFDRNICDESGRYRNRYRNICLCATDAMASRHVRLARCHSDPGRNFTECVRMRVPYARSGLAH